tara:strand:+ start:2291 stop:2422 length:132 start_codon:yes stop_codon:yes gene_type:complete
MKELRISKQKTMLNVRYDKRLLSDWFSAALQTSRKSDRYMKRE